MQVVKTLANGICDIILSGKFTFADHGQFRGILEDFPKTDVRQVVLHMQEIEFIDSAALGMLLLALDESKVHRKKLLLSGTKGHVKKIFEMAKFDTMFTLV